MNTTFLKSPDHTLFGFSAQWNNEYNMVYIYRTVGGKPVDNKILRGAQLAAFKKEYHG